MALIASAREITEATPSELTNSTHVRGSNVLTEYQEHLEFGDPLDPDLPEEVGLFLDALEAEVREMDFASL